MFQISDINSMDFHDTSIIYIKKSEDELAINFNCYNIDDEFYDVSIIISDITYITENGVDVSEIRSRGVYGDVDYLSTKEGELELVVSWANNHDKTIDVSTIKIGGINMKVHGEISKTAS